MICTYYPGSIVRSRIVRPSHLPSTCQTFIPFQIAVDLQFIGKIQSTGTITLKSMQIEEQTSIPHHI